MERDDGARLGAWMQDWVHVAPPGGESFVDVCTRARTWLDSLRMTRAHDAADVDGAALVVVTHAGFIRATIVTALALPAACAFGFAVDHLHATVLDVAPERATLLRGNVPLTAAFA
ncbi:MAG: histidine phosphatase family protein [Gemmatimonadaceae bacterium]|nr:histidine phosphatase family protein [Gemmatimonadaceae bacterium]